MKNVQKMAQRDAEKMMAADMFYGKGSGTRRKLVYAEIHGNKLKYADTDYADLLNLAYEHLDQNEFAKAAIRERKKIDRAAKATKNFNAIKTGNHRNLSNGVLLMVGGAYILHATGYDKILSDEAKRLYKKTKARLDMEIKMRKAEKS